MGRFFTCFIVGGASQNGNDAPSGKAGTLRIGIATAVSWHGLVVDSFRELRRWQPAVELELQHLLSVNQWVLFSAGLNSPGNPKQCVGTVPEVSFCSQLLIWMSGSHLT